MIGSGSWVVLPQENSKGISERSYLPNVQVTQIRFKLSCQPPVTPGLIVTITNSIVVIITINTAHFHLTNKCCKLSKAVPQMLFILKQLEINLFVRIPNCCIKAQQCMLLLPLV